MMGRHDLIGSSRRSVEIFEAAPGRLTFGSKAYFLFKLHDPTSGESGRQLLYWTCVACVREQNSRRRLKGRA